jgi:mannose-6-phosphate isomerase-like protein (cupin superfamily)
MIKNARKYGPIVIFLNTDTWLLRKKGFFYQSLQERQQILENIHGVVAVLPVIDSDNTVCETLKLYQPSWFGNAGDRTEINTPELDVCKELGITPVFGLGDPSTDHIHSSYIVKKGVVERKWGTYEVLADAPWYRVKRLLINPGQKTSLQKHDKRQEFMFYENGEVGQVLKGNLHRLTNDTDKVKEIIEVQTGVIEEDDITRYES